MVNVPLVLLYVATVAASLALAWLIHWFVQHRRVLRKHTKAHGLVGGLMEWWLYGRESNWSPQSVPVENDLPDQEIRDMWDQGQPAALRRSDHVKSVRLSTLELEHLTQAAAMRGLTLGQYIKRAAIQQASDDRTLEAVTATAGFGYVLTSRGPPTQPEGMTAPCGMP